MIWAAACEPLSKLHIEFLPRNAELATQSQQFNRNN